MLRNTKVKLCLFAVCIILMLLACSKPYVGRRVNSDNPYWCKVDELPASCSQADDEFRFDYEMKEGIIPSEYIIEGHATHTGLGFSTLVRGQWGGSHFALVLARKGIITDYIRLSLGGANLDLPMPFTRTFNSYLFDRAIIVYSAVLSD